MSNRLRLRYLSWPRPRLAITDTPRPGCATCRGSGWFLTGQPGAEEPDSVPCDCWNYSHQRTVLPLPRLRKRAAVSDEPPF
ncbi:hypothetical protein ACFW5V_32460 [Streptomyces sp. NPDC058762]|uniref:hypothetical protein n=1 Tax=Streptomyces sp. NPDC058762 TaxID=3346629 RepID=UPI00367F1AE0